MRTAFPKTGQRLTKHLKRTVTTDMSWHTFTAVGQHCRFRGRSACPAQEKVSKTRRHLICVRSPRLRESNLLWIACASQKPEPQPQSSCIGCQEILRGCRRTWCLELDAETNCDAVVLSPGPACIMDLQLLGKYSRTTPPQKKTTGYHGVARGNLKK